MHIQIDPELLCQDCTLYVDETLTLVRGVKDVEVNSSTGAVRVDYTDTLQRQALEDTIKSLPQYQASRAPAMKWER